jgi:protease-4
MYADFKSAVTSKRPKVADSTMQGQWFDGASADELYLVDELSNDTLDERVSRLLV